ncbi:MAG TPA: DUF4340 domain-containing protein [Cyclobacteriaceae bacterium]|nr:DUF4340 domain-containing protein [Cyclobacteriaceae bacterium]
MIALIMALFVFNSVKNNPSVDKGIFQIENLDKVDRVVLQSKNEKTDLSFNGTKWMVNGSHEADRQMIKVLFAALKQIEAKRAVASAIQDSVQKEINTTGIKVSCYEGEVLAKEFWSKGNAQNSETYFQLTDGVPFLVNIPGYRVYVASVFEVPTNDWRDKTVFNFNWQNIRTVEVKFPKNEKQNFRASFQNKIFSIENMKETDTTKLAAFMDALIQLRAERILTAEQSRPYDSLLATNPFQEITVQDIANRSYQLKIFPPQKRKSAGLAIRNEEVIELNPMGLREIYRTKDFFIARGAR